MENRTDLSRIGWDRHAYALVVLSASGISDREREKRSSLWSECERGNGSAVQLSFVYGPDAKLQFDRLTGINWDPTTAARLRKERQSLMLIVSGRNDEFRQFENFDPAKHHWYLLWFSKLTSKKKQLPDVFSQLIEACVRGDLFEFLKRSLENPTNAFPLGCLSSKHNPGRLPGRPTFLDPRYGVVASYKKIRAGYKELKKGDLTQIADEILRDPHCKNALEKDFGAVPSPKALIDALRAKKLL